MELESPTPPIAHLAELTAGRMARSWGRATGPQGVYIMSVKCLSVYAKTLEWVAISSPRESSPPRQYRASKFLMQMTKL